MRYWSFVKSTMLTEMRIESLPLDQLHSDCSDRKSSYLCQATEEQTYVITYPSHPSSAHTGMPHGASPIITPLVRTQTLPEIPVAGNASLVAPRSPQRKLKQRSHSFAMSDVRTMSRTDPIRKSLEAPITPRRHSKDSISLKLSNSCSSSSVRSTLANDNIKEKGKSRGTVSSNRQSNRPHKNRQKGKDEQGLIDQRNTPRDPSDLPECNSSFDGENSSDDSGEFRPRRIGFSPNSSGGSNKESSSSESNRLVQRTLHLTLSESSEDEIDSQQTTTRKPKSILKKRDLEFNIRKTQGVSFDDNEYRCRSDFVSPRHPTRSRSHSLPIFSPRPEISFTCSREFAAAMENLSDPENEPVFSDRT